MIEGIDYSDDVLVNGVNVTTTPQLTTVVDLDKYTHAALSAVKKSITINLGFMSDTRVNQLESNISKPYVKIKISSGQKDYTSVTLTRSASYIDNGELYWDSVTVSGVEA